jgi:hypothetical protein
MLQEKLIIDAELGTTIDPRMNIIVVIKYSWKRDRKVKMLLF